MTEPGPCRKLVDQWNAEWHDSASQHWGDSISWDTAKQIADRLDAAVLPELDDELTFILGVPNFRAGPLAHAYRDIDGVDIPPKSEVEQAFIIHKMLGYWFQHGSEWRTAFQADLDRLQAKAQEASA